MDPDVAYRKALQVVMAILIFTFIPSILPGQKKNNNSGNSSKPAAAPAQKPAQQKPATPAARPATRGAKPTTPGAKPATPGARSTTPSAKPTTPTAKPATPPATVHNPNGSITKPGANGSTVTIGKNGKRDSITTENGATAKYNASGKVSAVNFKSAKGYNTTVIHGARGGRTVVSEHNNERNEHIRMVNTGPHKGFVDHTIQRNGRPYMRRTVVVNGRATAYMYRGYPYRGVVYYGYVPAYYYGPAYYGWAYDPWGAQVVYGWGWGVEPWYGYYGGYFAPYPAYADASLWLTDYLLAENLRAAYQAQVDGNGGTAPAPSSDDQSGDANSAPAAQTATAMSPEVKQAIDDEVKAQLAAEKADASAATPTVVTGDQVPAALDPNHRTFIVSAQLQEQLDGGATCTLSAGDVLTRIDNAPDANQNVKVLVTSNQKGDCQSGAQVAVSVQDLQDMHNDFAAKIDAGLQKLADTQGKNGIPAGPAAGGQKNPDGTASADLTAAADLQQQQDAADQTEKEVKQAEGSGQGD